MTVFLRHTQPADRIAFKIKLDPATAVDSFLDPQRRRAPGVDKGHHLREPQNRVCSRPDTESARDLSLGNRHACAYTNSYPRQASCSSTIGSRLDKSSASHDNRQFAPPRAERLQFPGIPRPSTAQAMDHSEFIGHLSLRNYKGYCFYQLISLSNVDHFRQCIGMRHSQ